MAEDLRLQFLRGNTAQNNAYTGADGELTVDTDRKTLRLHDGKVVGGEELISKTNFYPIKTAIEEIRVYVSGLYGDDANEGTESSPFKTIGHALSLYGQRTSKSLMLFLRAEEEYLLDDSFWIGSDNFHIYGYGGVDSRDASKNPRLKAKAIEKVDTRGNVGTGTHQLLFSKYCRLVNIANVDIETAITDDADFTQDVISWQGTLFNSMGSRNIELWWDHGRLYINDTSFTSLHVMGSFGRIDVYLREVSVIKNEMPVRSFSTRPFVMDSYGSIEMPAIIYRTSNRSGSDDATPDQGFGDWREVLNVPERNLVTNLYTHQDSGTIESGSNDNGEYTRLADGTQLCRMKKVFIFDGTATEHDIPNGIVSIAKLEDNSNILNIGTDAFPASFSNEHIVSMGANIAVKNKAHIFATPRLGGGGVTYGLSTFKFDRSRVIDDPSTLDIADGDQLEISIDAVGRWYPMPV